MLISAIITEILSDVGADTSDTTLAGKALIWVKDALRMFPMFTRSRLLVTTSTVSLPLGLNYAALPTGFLSEKVIYRTENGANTIIELSSNFQSIVNTENTGKPDFYHIIGSTIYFDKKADAAYSIYIEHTKEVDDVAAGDTFFGDSSMIKVLKDGAKAAYYSDYVEEPNRGAEKLSMFAQELNQIESRHMIQTQGTHID